MNITIISIFRQATHYLERYFEQMDDLQRLLNARGDSLYLLLGYGDSTDGTGEALWDECANRFGAHLMDVSHGGPSFGSIEHPQRFKQLAYCGNRLLGCIPPNADVVGIVESDLIWQAETMLQLLEDLDHVDAVAPMVMDGESSFYDVYAHRRKGVRFHKTPPFHPDIDADSDLLEVDSAGSVLFMSATLARKARFSDDTAIVGFCESLREQGASIFVNTQATVSHLAPHGEQRPAHRETRASGLLRV